MKAVLAGAFDPFTAGHRDLALRASKIFDGVIVAVAEDTGKATAALSDRLAIAELSTSNLENVEVVPFSGLLTDFLNENAPVVLLRGLRGVRDAEYERDLCRIYGGESDCECVYLFSRAELEHVSSTTVRQLAELGGKLDSYVVPQAADYVKKVYCKTAKRSNHER
ncbi:MAG: pantetheine-phosphate adenylyltransferase [Clostridiales bacterium]|nr:pantetheine-phosphate adenylyltransferase [Clostridiales bacterium]